MTLLGLIPEAPSVLPLAPESFGILVRAGLGVVL